VKINIYREGEKPKSESDSRRQRVAARHK